MKRISKVLLLFFVISLIFAATGCSGTGIDSELQGDNIIDPKEVAALLEGENVMLVDAQKPEEYEIEHIKGAVNISREDVLIDIPVKGMLAPKGKVETLLGENGISNDTTVLIYDDNNNVDASRIWWTLMVYGHEEDKIKVISGGFNALKAVDMKTTKDIPAITAVKYTAKDKNNNMIATLNDVKAQVDDPKDDVVVLDTRTQEEYDEGAIPGSILLDYLENNYKDGTFKSPENIQIQYIEKGITPDKTVIILCKTGARASQTYVALHNAGYRNLKVYDGSWTEWSANDSLPVQGGTDAKVESNQQDNS